MAVKFSLDNTRVEHRPVADHTVTLEIPWLPPSTNNLYLNIPGRGRVKSREYNGWLADALQFLALQKPPRFTDRVDILIKVEDRHSRRDASNVIKPLEDLLVKAGIIQDDRAKFVRKISAEWCPSTRNVSVQIARAA